MAKAKNQADALSVEGTPIGNVSASQEPDAITVVHPEAPVTEVPVAPVITVINH